MNTPRTFSQSVLALLLLVLATGCDFQEASDAFDQIDVILTLEDINTTVVGTVVDAQNGNFVRRDVRLTFAGDNAGDLVDIYSDPVGARTIKDGVTAFGIANSVVPSDGNPVSFRVIANKEGYETGVANIVINEEGQHEFRINLIPQNRTVAGTTRQTGTSQTSGSGATTTTTTVQTQPTAEAQTTATVTVPAGTQATTDSGQTLSGTVTTNVNYFPPTSESALQAFPGGMTNVTVTGGSGGTRTTTAVSAGLVNVSVTDADGNKASQVSQPISVTMEIPAEFLGADNQNNTFDITRYDPKTGTWVVVQEGVTLAPAGKNSSASGTVTFDASILTYYGVLPSPSPTNPACTMTYNVDRNGVTGNLRFHISSSGFTLDNRLSAGANTYVITNAAPNRRTITARVYSSSDPNTTLGSVSTEGFCNGGAGGDETATMQLSSPALATVDFTLKAGADCGAINFSGDIPAFSAYYKPEGASDSEATLISDSDITFNRTPNNLRIQDVDARIQGVRPGTNLEFFAVLDSERQNFDQMITVPAGDQTVATTFDVDNDLCSSN